MFRLIHAGHSETAHCQNRDCLQLCFCLSAPSQCIHNSAAQGLGGGARAKDEHKTQGGVGVQGKREHSLGVNTLTALLAEGALSRRSSRHADDEQSSGRSAGQDCKEHAIFSLCCHCCGFNSIICCLVNLLFYNSIMNNSVQLYFLYPEKYFWLFFIVYLDDLEVFTYIMCIYIFVHTLFSFPFFFYCHGMAMEFALKCCF